MQRWLGLPVTGIVDEKTWDELYDQYSGIENTVFRNGEAFPSTNFANGSNSSRSTFSRTSTMTQFPGNSLQNGSRDPVNQEVVR
jgi:hypothetical protein